MILLIIIGIVGAVASYSIAKSKDRNAFGWFLVGLIPVIGLVIVVLLTANGKKCPQCAEIIRLGARVCRYCSYRFP